MQILITFSIFIALVILGSYLNSRIPRVPAALFQIILGFSVTFLPISLHFEFESEAFMALIIAPLLFTDAFKSSRANLWLYKKPILYMAVGLVLVTVIIVGSFINLIFPAITLGASFALAAILSPTDAVAVKSITKGMKLPKGLMAILEGESLLNDAAGLVSFNIALGAIITGTFSLGTATQNFITVALGGAILGLILGIVLSRAKSFLLQSKLEDEVAVLVIFQLITPLIVYFLAEHIHVSGIVAVVITGIIYNFEKNLFQRESTGSEAAISIETTQTSVVYILNGFVFVSLGFLLPEIFRNMLTYREIEIQVAIIYVILITLALMLTRFLFVYIFYIQFQKHSFSSARKVARYFTERKLDVGNYSRVEYAFITSLCGIHGTVTLATALLIPLTLSDGTAFPLRNVILFIGSSVVLLSMIIGTIFLPLVIKSTDEEDYMEQRAIKEFVLKETMRELKENRKKEQSKKEQIAFATVMKKLQEQEVHYSEDSKYLIKETQRIYNTIYRQERQLIKEIATRYDNNKTLEGVLVLTSLRIKKLLTYSITKQVCLQIVLSFKEAQFKRLRVLYSILRETSTSRGNARREARFAEVKERFLTIKDLLPEISEEIYAAAEKTARELETEENKLIVEFILDIYKNFAPTQYQVYVLDESYDEEVKTLQMEAIQLQKYRIMTMKKLNHIDKHDVDMILRDLNYNEALLFVGEEE